jgi:hypothetical protein
MHAGLAWIGTAHGMEAVRRESGRSLSVCTCRKKRVLSVRRPYCLAVAMQRFHEERSIRIIQICMRERGKIPGFAASSLVRDGQTLSISARDIRLLVVVDVTWSDVLHAYQFPLTPTTKKMQKNSSSNIDRSSLVSVCVY